MTDLYRDGLVPATGHKRGSVPCSHRAELAGSWCRAVPLEVLSQAGNYPWLGRGAISGHCKYRACQKHVSSEGIKGLIHLLPKHDETKCEMLIAMKEEEDK